MPWPPNNTCQDFIDMTQGNIYTAGVAAAMSNAANGVRAGGVFASTTPPSPLSPVEMLEPAQTAVCSCYDVRMPSYNTVIYGDSRKGFLPAGSWNFTREGTVINACNGVPLSHDSLYARTNGPIYGVTMSSCVNRASESKLMNLVGQFNVLPSTMARKCFL